jgi:pimeloyl-ACP methyl ester carboxylesterase
VFAELEGKKIHYVKSGKGKCVVMLHGFLENLTIWDDFAAELALEYKIIQIDLPGHGKTEVMNEIHSMTLMSGAVNTVLDKEGISEAIVVGHSMGGYVTLEFAQNFSDKIKGVCLFNSTALADSKIKKEERNRVVKVLQKNATFFVNEAVPNLFTPENRIPLKPLIDELIREALENPLEGIIACTKGMRDRHDKLDFLKNIDFPLLYIIGRKDNVIPFEKMKDQLYANNNISIFVSAQCGHMGFIEDRDGTFSALHNFISQTYRN